VSVIDLADSLLGYFIKPNAPVPVKVWAMRQIKGRLFAIPNAMRDGWLSTDRMDKVRNGKRK